VSLVTLGHLRGAASGREMGRDPHEVVWSPSNSELGFWTPRDA
jgi:hypothetical protein